MRKVNESLKDAKEMLLETGEKVMHHGQNFGKIIARDNTENRQRTYRVVYLHGYISTQSIESTNILHASYEKRKKINIS